MVDSILGEIPASWTTTTLGEVCARGGGSIQTGPFGSQLHASDYVQDGVPVVMPVNIGDNRIDSKGIARIRPADAQRLHRHLLEEGDIVYSRRGDIERRALVKTAEAGWLCGTGCLRVRLGKGVVDPAFAAYYLGHPSARQWIVRHAVGATMLNLNTGILEALPFVLPPLRDQLLIAALLSALDDKIELNRRMNQTLEAMVRTIFKSWFVDFDHPLPADWSYERIGDCCEFHYGKALRAEDRIKGTIPVFGSNGQVGWHNDSLVKGPGIIIGRKGSPGTVTWTSSDFFPIDTAFYVANRRTSLSLFYLFHALLALDLPSLAADSAVPGLNRNIAYDSEILVPAVALIERFDCQASPLQAKIDANIQNTSILESIRDTLLPKLLSGEIRVRQAEKTVGEVVRRQVGSQFRRR